MSDISVLLVHGTFAVDAAWTMEGSEFRKAIEASFSPYGHSVQFERIKWSGKNWVSARLSAASEIRNHVLAAKGAGRPTILVGHSHGGSAISYFLKHYVEDASTISACVFLSTPFLTFKARPGLAQRVRAWTYASLFAGQIALLISLSFATAYLGYNTMAFYVALAINLLLGAILLHLHRSFDPFAGATAKVREAIDSIIEERDSCDLPRKEYLFVKFSGDEASVGLTFAQSLAYVAGQTIQRGYQSLSGLLRTLSIRLPAPLREIAALYLAASWLLCSPFLASYTLSYDEVLRLTSTKQIATEQQLSQEIDDLTQTLAAVGAEYHVGDSQQHNRIMSYLSPEERREFHRYWNHLVLSLQNDQEMLGKVPLDNKEFLIYRIVQVTFALSVILSLLFVVFVALASLTALCLAAFGSLSLVEVLFMETSVEVVPHGAHVLHHLNWREETDKDVLRHSHVYSAPNSIELIAQWMASRYAHAAH